MCLLSEGTSSSTVYSVMASKADSGTLRLGSSRRMAMTANTPTARQKSPGTVVASTFIDEPVMSA